MIQVLLISSAHEGDRLTAQEAEVLTDFCYQIHDHQARTPQPVLFWWRDKSGTSKGMN